MLRRFFYSVALVSFSLSLCAAQIDTTKPVTVAGTVKLVEADRLVLDTARGEVTMTIAANASVKKVPASNLSPAAATPASITEVVVGDRVVMTTLPMADGKLNPARTVLIISKADIASRDKSLTDAWRTRGIAGVVDAVNPETNQITIKVAGPMGTSSNIIVTPKPTAKFKKYAPDSNKYSDAKASTFANIAKDDSIQALGDRSDDGTSFSAEEILTGSFQQILGTVKSVDSANNEVVITERATNKDITISLAGATLMKRFPAEFAQRMFGQNRPGGQAPAGAQPPMTDAPRPLGHPGVARPGGVGPRGNFNQMVEQFPTVTVAELQNGEMIGVVAAKSDLTAKVKAFKLVAGIEPFVRMAEMQAQARGGQRGQMQMQIPGLDGFSMP